MINETQYRQIVLALWPQGDATPGSLWAVLDCAKDRRIYRELRLSRLDYQCLYSGDVPTELRVVAPHMVELSPRYSFTKTLLGQCWGRSWGIFVRTNDGTSLRHQLRKLLTVRSEDGTKMLFRFYDPRVLRVYLPTCTREENELVFSRIRCFYAESDKAEESLLSFEFDGRTLQRRVIPLSHEPTKLA